MIRSVYVTNETNLLFFYQEMTDGQEKENTEEEKDENSERQEEDEGKNEPGFSAQVLFSNFFFG